MSGICVDALNPAGCPGADALFTAGADGVRLVAFDDPAFFAYAGDLLVSMRVAVVIARESCADDDFGGWCSFYSERISPTYWLIGNEEDAGRIPADSPSSWAMEPVDYIDFWHQAATAIREIQPDATLIMGGVVSGDVTYVDEVWPQLDPRPDGLDCHPYNKTASEARELLHLYQEVLG